MKKVSRAFVSFALALTAACSDGPSNAPAPDGGIPDGGTSALAPIVGTPRFVVRHSDYASSAFSLLDAQGDVLADGWIHSGSMPPGLTAVLSGDTDVPTAFEPGVLTILDRFGSDVVTRVQFATGNVLGQVRTQGVSTSGFSGNPQDVVVVAPDSAWVSRYGHNLMPGASPDVAGSDLIEIDPSTMTLTGERISLTSFEQPIQVTGTSGTVTVTARARPNRIVRIGSHLAVGLDLVSDGFEGAAPGRLAVVNPGTGDVDSFDLAPLTNCGTVLPVPGEAAQVAVVCKGWADRTAESGLVLLSIDGSTGAVTELDRYATADHASEDYVFDSVVVLGDGTFLGVHVGGWAPTDPPDTLVRVTLADGNRSTLLTAAHPSDLFVTMAFDATTGLLLVPDASVGVRRYQRATDGSFSASSHVTPSGRGLPITSVAVLP